MVNIENVLIPFLSGLFFQQKTACKTTSRTSLNPLSIGSVFPTATPYHADAMPKVLIPFLSGLFFQPSGNQNHHCIQSLNPLSIGSVFPTVKAVDLPMKDAS